MREEGPVQARNGATVARCMVAVHLLKPCLVKGEGRNGEEDGAKPARKYGLESTDRFELSAKPGACRSKIQRRCISRP